MPDIDDGPLGDAQTGALLAEALTKQPQILTGPDGRAYLALPDGYTHHDISDPHGPAARKPAFVAAAVALQTVESLTDYVGRFRSESTVLFADIAGSAIRAVIDYHGRPGADGVAVPDRARHAASMVLPFSEEWRIWSEASGKLVPQLEFARFIEENGADVVAPDAAELLELVHDLQARRKVNFVAAVRTATNNQAFEFEDRTDLKTKGDMELPTRFLLTLPVYFGESPGAVSAFLRWHLDEGVLKLGIVLHRAEHVRQAAFKAIVTRVVEATGCPVVYGKP